MTQHHHTDIHHTYIHPIDIHPIDIHPIDIHHTSNRQIHDDGQDREEAPCPTQSAPRRS